MLIDYLKSLSTFQKIKYGIIILYFVLNLAFLILSFNMSTDNLKMMIKMGRYSNYMRYFAILAMGLFFTVVSMYYVELKGLKRKRELDETEITKLKSKLYDQGKGDSRDEIK